MCAGRDNRHPALRIAGSRCDRDDVGIVPYGISTDGRV